MKMNIDPKMNRNLDSKSIAATINELIQTFKKVLSFSLFSKPAKQVTVMTQEQQRLLILAAKGDITSRQVDDVFMKPTKGLSNLKP